MLLLGQVVLDDESNQPALFLGRMPDIGNFFFVRNRDKLKCVPNIDFVTVLFKQNEKAPRGTEIFTGKFCKGIMKGFFTDRWIDRNEKKVNSHLNYVKRLINEGKVFVE